MDLSSIVVVTLAMLQALALLVVAGVTLQARSFTALLALVAEIGSKVAALEMAARQVQTTLLTGTVPDGASAQQGTTPTTPDNQEP